MIAYRASENTKAWTALWVKKTHGDLKMVEYALMAARSPQGLSNPYRVSLYLDTLQEVFPTRSEMFAAYYAVRDVAQHSVLLSMIAWGRKDPQFASAKRLSVDPLLSATLNGVLFGTFIRQERGKASIDALAARAGLSSKTWKAMESGDPTSLDAQLLACQALGVEWLQHRYERPKPVSRWKQLLER